MPTLRTSQTHPLHFGIVPCGTGQLGLTICPGKQGDSVYGEPWARDLDTDIRAIVDWGAGPVVTLMEAHEFPMLGVPDLGDRLEGAGLDWFWLPIPDISTPTRDFETLWVHAGPVLRARLRAGERVVIHCRGGLGRTGLVAARLLIEFGTDPNDAIRIVRQARPGAIETRAQEQYVSGLRAGHGDDGHADRVLGCLLGGAVGDAFGYAIEFDSLAVIRQQHGPDGLRTPLLHRGHLIVSDDTQMTLFTAAGLLTAVRGARSPTDGAMLEAIRRATLDWSATQGDRDDSANDRQGLLAHDVLWARRAPGNTCLSACRAGAPGTPESPVNGSKGCGGMGLIY